MHRWVSLIAAHILGLSIIPTVAANDAFDWDQWRALPVQNGGRQKPLDTLAWETLRTIANRGSWVDEESKQRLKPTALYLTILMEWRGWEHRDKAHLELVKDWRPLYFHLHEADRWDRAPLLRVDSPALREALGLQKDQDCVAPIQLANAMIIDPRSERELPFSAWGDRLMSLREADETLTEIEQSGLELAIRYWSYQNHRMGRTLEVLPIQDNEERKWLPIAYLLLRRFDDASDPTGELRKSQSLFAQARQSFLEHDIESFNRNSQQLMATLSRLGPTLGNYPTHHSMTLEVAYNDWAPFRIGWILMLAAVIGTLLYWGSNWRPFFAGAWVTYVAALLAIAIGFAMRIAIAGRPPVTNMYESVVYVGAGVAILGIVFELIYRRKYIITAAAMIATIALVLADNCPVILDPSMQPLEPVLRSNFWLITHVMTITLSYAAMALALGIANITLGYFIARSNNRDIIHWLSHFTYKAIQVGVLLLSAGVILGGVWADYSWGRFWGWDPKEVWALVALLGYLAVLHARFAGWVSHRGLAALTVACFSLIVMAWYGVNFVLGAGLHSYGFGGGGKAYVYAAVVLQLLYVAVALLPKSHVDEDVRAEPIEA